MIFLIYESYIKQGIIRRKTNASQTFNEAIELRALIK